MKIKITQINKFEPIYMAEDQNSGATGFGHTQKEAIGDLVYLHSKMLNIELTTD